MCRAHNALAGPGTRAPAGDGAPMASSWKRELMLLTCQLGHERNQPIDVRIGIDVVQAHPHACDPNGVGQRAPLAMEAPLFADGADQGRMLELYSNLFIKGLTTDPTPMRQAGIADYTVFAQDIVRRIPDRPISFEFFLTTSTTWNDGRCRSRAGD